MTNANDNQTTKSPTNQQTIDATRIVHSFELRTGISPKSGNPYSIGVLKIKTARGRTYSLDLKYLDDNAIDTIEDALDAADKQSVAEVSDGLR